MTGGSQQTRLYRRARRDGATMMTACANSGIPLSEARLIDAEDRRNPPPEEAFQLLTTASFEAPEEEVDDMARSAKKSTEEVENIDKPDFEKAVRIFRHNIKPANEKSGEHAQAASTGYKAIKKDCHVNTRAAKFVFQLSGESEEKRNDVLRSVRGLLEAMNIGITDDLVSDAEGEPNTPIVPTKKPAQLGLVTVN